MTKNIDITSILRNQANDKTRIEEIDILKALGIICMVLGHAGAPFTKFIYLFHMAIFFIASGFFYKESSSDSIKNVMYYTIKKIKLLWVPYFVWNMFFTLLNNLFIKINVYTDNSALLNHVSGRHVRTHSYMSAYEMVKNVVKGAFFGGSTEMGGALWFLQVLFMVSICYCIGDYISKKIFNKSLVSQLIVSVALLIFGYSCFLNDFNLFGIGQTASFYCLFFIGYYLRIIRCKYRNWNRKQFCSIFAVSFSLLLILNKFGEIALDQNSYVNPAFLLAASFAGWGFLYSISYFIALLPIKNLFVEIGKRTLTVVILHFLSFKLVAIIVVKIYGLPFFCVAAFPNLYGNVGIWWLLYSAIGIGIPIVLNVGYKFLINKILRMKVRTNYSL